DAREVRALVVAARLELVRVLARLFAGARALDLDHPRAHVGEEPRAVRPREDAGEVENHEAAQRERVVGSPLGHVTLCLRAAREETRWSGLRRGRWSGP